jgi:hypothetical protein
MNDNAPRQATSIWPINTPTGPAIRAIFEDGGTPVVWPLSQEEVISFCLELLSATRFPKVS